MPKKTYKEMSRKLSARGHREISEDARLELDPQEEIKKAFTLMTDEQLRFLLSLGGKNAQYAQALIDHRNKSKLDPK